MTNKNYNNGRAKEYRMVKKLRAAGYDLVQRTAGSHSYIDIIAIRKLDNKILFVQCKPKSMGINKKAKLEKELAWLKDNWESDLWVV